MKFWKVETGETKIPSEQDRGGKDETWESGKSENCDLNRPSDLSPLTSDLLPLFAPLMTCRRVDYPSLRAEIAFVPSSYGIQTTPVLRASPTELPRATVVN